MLGCAIFRYLFAHVLSELSCDEYMELFVALIRTLNVQRPLVCFRSMIDESPKSIH